MKLQPPKCSQTALMYNRHDLMDAEQARQRIAVQLASSRVDIKA